MDVVKSKMVFTCILRARKCFPECCFWWTSPPSQRSLREGQSWSCGPCRRPAPWTRCTKSPGERRGNNDPPTPPRTAGTLKTPATLTRSLISHNILLTGSGFATHFSLFWTKMVGCVTAKSVKISVIFLPWIVDVFNRCIKYLTSNMFVVTRSWSKNPRSLHSVKWTQTRPSISSQV